MRDDRLHHWLFVSIRQVRTEREHRDAYKGESAVKDFHDLKLRVRLGAARIRNSAFD
jgi:hypothetical protein